MDEAMVRKYGALLNALDDGALLVRGGRICCQNEAARAFLGQETLPPELESLAGAGAGVFRREGNEFDVTARTLEGDLRLLLLRPAGSTACRSDGVPLPAAYLGGTYSTMLSELLMAAQVLEARLGRGPEAPGCRDTLAVLDRSCHRLLRLSQNLTLFAQLRCGQRRLPGKTEDFSAFFRNVAEEAEGYLQEAGLRLEVQQLREPAATCFDPDLCQRLIYQLLVNGVQASAPGDRLALRLSREGQRLFLQVEDWGRGIPEARLGDLFQSYVRSERDPEQEGGFGLGLALCREIAMLHGGSVALWSREGKGTRVTVSLPLRQPSEEMLRDGKVPRSGEGFAQGMIELSDVLPSEAYR